MAERSDSDRIKFRESPEEFPFEFMRETERRLGRIPSLTSLQLGEMRFAYVSHDIEHLSAGSERARLTDPNKDAVVPSPIRYLRKYHKVDRGVFSLPWAEYDRRRTQH
jgi:hypothetical protein